MNWGMSIFSLFLLITYVNLSFSKYVFVIVSCINIIFGWHLDAKWWLDFKAFMDSILFFPTPPPFNLVATPRPPNFIALDCRLIFPFIHCFPFKFHKRWTIFDMVGWVKTKCTMHWKKIIVYQNGHNAPYYLIPHFEWCFPSLINFQCYTIHY